MKKFMKEYESPILFVLSFAQDDVIRTSNGGGFDEHFGSGGFNGEDEEFIFG